MSNAQHPPFKVHMPIADHLFWMPVRCPVVSINGLWRVAINENGRPPYGGYCLKLLPLPSWGTITTNCETVIVCGSCRMHPRKSSSNIAAHCRTRARCPSKAAWYLQWTVQLRSQMCRATANQLNAKQKHLFVQDPKFIGKNSASLP